MRSRWIALLALALCTLSGCGRVGAESARDDLPSEYFVVDDGVSDEGTELGEEIVWDEELRLRVDVVGVDTDDRGPWLTVTYQLENTSSRERLIPLLGLACDQSDGAGSVAPDDWASTPTHVPADESLTLEQRLVLPGDQRVGEEIPACEGSLTIDVELPEPSGATQLLSPGWIVPDELREELNAARPEPPHPGPSDEPSHDPDRPYGWVEKDELTSGYQVVVVPGMTADEAIRILDPVRGSASWDDFERVIVAEHDRGVVLFTYSYVPDRYVRALSRGGLAATYGNTVEGDDHILVTRNGKIVRSFDPFMGDSFDGSKPLPEEKGLDLADDTWAASWTLLERITGIHITEDWLLGDSHPGFRLQD